MSLDSSVIHWVYRCAPCVVEPADEGGFHELDSLFYLYHPRHNSVEVSLVFRVSIPFHSHVGSTHSPTILLPLLFFVKFAE